MPEAQLPTVSFHGVYLLLGCYLQLALRVQVPNNHILTQNLYYHYYYPNPKYLIIGYMDPLGSFSFYFSPWGLQDASLNPKPLAHTSTPVEQHEGFLKLGVPFWGSP